MLSVEQLALSLHKISFQHFSEANFIKLSDFNTLLLQKKFALDLAINSDAKDKTLLEYGLIGFISLFRNSSCWLGLKA